MHSVLLSNLSLCLASRNYIIIYGMIRWLHTACQHKYYTDFYGNRCDSEMVVFSPTVHSSMYPASALQNHPLVFKILACRKVQLSWAANSTRWFKCIQSWYHFAFVDHLSLVLHFSLLSNRMFGIFCRHGIGWSGDVWANSIGRCYAHIHPCHCWCCVGGWWSRG